MLCTEARLCFAGFLEQLCKVLLPLLDLMALALSRSEIFLPPWLPTTGEVCSEEGVIVFNSSAVTEAASK